MYRPVSDVGLSQILEKNELPNDSIVSANWNSSAPWWSRLSIVSLFVLFEWLTCLTLACFFFVFLVSTLRFRCFAIARFLCMSFLTSDTPKRSSSARCMFRKGICFRSLATKCRSECRVNNTSFSYLRIRIRFVLAFLAPIVVWTESERTYYLKRGIFERRGLYLFIDRMRLLEFG